MWACKNLAVLIVGCIAQRTSGMSFMWYDVPYALVSLKVYLLIIFLRSKKWHL